MNKTALLLALMLPSTLLAEEKRELGAHEHGHSALNIAVEGNQIAMDLEAPGADIVGFEYEAETQQDRAKVEAAIAALSDPLSLFVFPAAAACKAVEVDAHLVGEHHDAQDDEHDEHHHETHDEHDEHAHSEHDEHEHAEHDHDAHDADEHAHEGPQHNEFHAKYLLNCANINAIDRIEFAFFEKFPNAQEVDVQVISDKGATGFEVEREAPVLGLSAAL